MSDDNKKKRSESAYKVGYGKPPKSGQFKKGQSGYIKGRPKARRSFRDLLSAEAFKMMKINVNGETVSVTRAHAFVIAELNRAMAGNSQAARRVWEFLYNGENGKGDQRTESEWATFMQNGDNARKQLDAQLDLIRERIKANEEKPPGGSDDAANTGQEPGGEDKLD